MGLLGFYPPFLGNPHILQKSEGFKLESKGAGYYVRHIDAESPMDVSRQLPRASCALFPLNMALMETALLKIAKGSSQVVLEWVWFGYLNTEPNRVFGALGMSSPKINNH